jgi:hypothetical protein
MRNSLLLLAYFSVAACIASLGAAIGYIALRQRPTTDTLEPSAMSQEFAGGRDDAAEDHETVVLRSAEPPQPLAFLAITAGPYADTMLPLHGGTVKVGCDPSRNDHPIDDAAVSAQHLSIRYRDGAFVATDLDSINGTFVNGRRIDRHLLAANDVVQIGTTRLVFMQVPNGRAAVS